MQLLLPLLSGWCLGSVLVLLRKEDKTRIKLDLDFLSKEQIADEISDLLNHYEADKSQADLNNTRRILKRFGDVTDELAAMREENR